ncbi:DNA-binding protein [Candidatus Williamhamiltonella defendens]|nr:Rha family transcriptional regulator [Candidatus Hamiltonella defensa]AYB48726.1 DNA-binding protein [Candidatus Hamiltonella defensa]
MQNLITFQSLTMSSTEIAELVNKRHDNVKRTIETLAKSEIIQLPQSEKVENKQSNSPNRFTEVFIFEGEQGKRDSIIVVAQLCPEFTACLVDRWQELEQELNTPSLPTNYIEALEALVISEKEKAVITDQRDEAIRTKSHISRKREATALQRNSAYQRIANRAIREREKMAARFGASKEWASQQAVWRATGKMFGWKVLNAWLDKHDIYDALTSGYPTCFNPDQNRREVIYPREAWLEIHGIDIAELF